MNHTEGFKEIPNIQYICPDYKNLCQLLGDYVLNACSHRDPSHGYQHMKKVAMNTMIIFSKMYEEITLVETTKKKFGEFILVVSWTHDVADRKYDSDGSAKLKLCEFLDNNFPNESKLILDTISRTSFSFEINMIKETGKLDWLEKLGPDGVLGRDIVSDADKLEAIGYEGIIRLFTYNHELFKKNNPGKPVTYEDVKILAERQIEVKLGKLQEQYIRTRYGKELGEALHNETMLILADKNKMREIYDMIYQ